MTDEKKGYRGGWYERDAQGNESHGSMNRQSAYPPEAVELAAKAAGGGIEAEKVEPIELEAGRLYESRNGQVWCCFKIDQGRAQARCIRVFDERLSWFELDGRLGFAGVGPHSLYREVSQRSSV